MHKQHFISNNSNCFQKPHLTCYPFIRKLSNLSKFHFNNFLSKLLWNDPLTIFTMLRKYWSCIKIHFSLAKSQETFNWCPQKTKLSGFLMDLSLLGLWTNSMTKPVNSVLAGNRATLPSGLIDYTMLLAWSLLACKHQMCFWATLFTG